MTWFNQSDSVFIIQRTASYWLNESTEIRIEGTCARRRRVHELFMLKAGIKLNEYEADHETLHVLLFFLVLAAAKILKIMICCHSNQHLKYGPHSRSLGQSFVHFHKLDENLSSSSSLFFYSPCPKRDFSSNL